MISGGQPDTACAMNLAKIGRPSFSATDLLASKTAAAPSVTYEAFPAVVVPSLLNAGFNLAKPSTVVSFLMPSSLSIKTSFVVPSGNFTLVLIGIISSLYKPVS